MVARFLDGLAGDGGKFCIAGAGKPLPQQLEPGGHHRVAQHTEGEVAARQFHQREVEIIALIAQKGELVFVVREPFDLAGAGQNGARLANQI